MAVRHSFGTVKVNDTSKSRVRAIKKGLNVAMARLAFIASHARVGPTFPAPLLAVSLKVSIGRDKNLLRIQLAYNEGVLP